MKLALYGGSFDPIHQGHIEPILAAQTALDLDRVFYLPTARPPHKSPRMASSLARFAMVELALLDHPRLQVSGFEMQRPERAYTIDSVEHFRSQYPEDQLHLLIGADSFVAFDRWKRYLDLLRLSQVVVLVRPGSDPRDSDRLTPELQRAAQTGQVQFIENSPLPASSTEIRRQLADGICPGYLPPRVLDYITKYGLYRS